MTDPYSANPLAEMLAERDPWRFDRLTKVSTPPKMFANGTADVPAFTASGIEPNELLRLPFGVRHAVAENPDIVAVYQMFEQYAGIPEMEIDSPGLQDAKIRAEQWMRDTDTRTPEQIRADEAENEAWYQQQMRIGDRYGLLHEEHQALLHIPTEERHARFEAAAKAKADAQRAGQPIPTPEWAQAEGAQA
ncbi:hypothetical protein [Nocardioides sp. CFH 31398]|uniref:hypothetical protein n=1 Tax=Nocardioides sp. CFH 31398 TaxID=2919579 RepID=UPI001F060108|nr:hypothetical protein [Nocardioides sp. CFH 31398]MCH1867083.1 hypothetical protein [Nocardioides sp. CFH 31398]